MSLKNELLDERDRLHAAIEDDDFDGLVVLVNRWRAQGLDADDILERFTTWGAVDLPTAEGWLELVDERDMPRPLMFDD